MKLKTFAFNFDKNSKKSRLGIIVSLVFITLCLSASILGQNVEGKGYDSYWCPICKAYYPGSHYHFQQNRSNNNSSGGGLIGGLLNWIFRPSKPQPPLKTRKERGSELNEIGFDLYNQGDYAGAERYFKKALRMNPKSQNILGNVSNSLNEQGLKAYKQGDFSRAASLFEEALEYDPDNQTKQKNLAAALARLANEADDKGDKRQAEKLMDKALYFDPNNQDIKNGLRYLREYLADQERLKKIRGNLGKIIDSFSRELEQTGWSASTAVVDLTFLDPGKPIVVDPNVVKGKPRRIPIQPGSSTPKGESYDLGFEKLKQGDPAAAVELFKRAETENPDNPSVRDAMDLAGDLVKVSQDAARDQAEREKFTTARLAFFASVDAMRKSDLASAGDFLARAINTNPFDADLRASANSMQMYLYWAEKAQPASTAREEDKKFYAAVAERSSQAMTALILKDYQRAVNELDAADALFADQFFLDIYLPEDKYGEKADASTVKNEAMMREGLTAARRQAARLLSEKGK